MKALWRLRLTGASSAGTTMERLSEAPSLLLPPAVKKALAHLQTQVPMPTVALVIELNCECDPGVRAGLCAALRGEGWEDPAAQLDSLINKQEVKQ